MKVFVCSRNQFKDILSKNNITSENVENKEDIIFISINNTSGDSYKPYFKENKKNVLVLYFDDASLEETIEHNKKNKKILIPFDENHALEIIKFLENNSNAKTSFVHCSAGISRSGAVGTFINDYFHGDFYEFKNLNKDIQPNQHIIRILNNTYRNYEISEEF
jgi:predicted protein tyrosine phosphatase